MVPTMNSDELLHLIEEAIQQKLVSSSSNNNDRDRIEQQQPNILHAYLYGSRVYFNDTTIGSDSYNTETTSSSSNRDYDTVVIVPNDLFTTLIQICKQQQQLQHNNNSAAATTVAELENNNDGIIIEEEEPMKLELFLLNSNKQYYKILHTFYSRKNSGGIAIDAEISMSIYSERIFQRMIQDHSIFILFCVHNRNPIVKLKETWPRWNDPNATTTTTATSDDEKIGLNQSSISLSQYYYDKYFEKHKFVPSVLSEVNRAWQKFYNKIVKDRDENKGMKLVVYCFRFLAWASELLQNHCVSESVCCGNEIYWKLCEILNNFDRVDYKSLYQTIFKEFGEKYDYQVDQFTKQSEFSSLYPTINLTKLETTELIIDNPSTILKEMKSLLKGLNGIEDLYRLFSIECTRVITPMILTTESAVNHDDITSNNNNNLTLIQLNAHSDASPREYPIVGICRTSNFNSSSLIVGNVHNGEYIFKTIPFIPNIRMELTESACREIALKNNSNTAADEGNYHEIYVSRKGQEFFSVWWNFQTSQWNVNNNNHEGVGVALSSDDSNDKLITTTTNNILSEFIACLPNLLLDDNEFQVLLESYSIIIQLEQFPSNNNNNNNNLANINLIGYTYSDHQGKFSQKFVKKFEDFEQHLLPISNDNFQTNTTLPFTIQFRQPILTIQSRADFPNTFDSYRNLVLNHNQIQDILQDNRVIVMEIFSFRSSSTLDVEPFYTFITTPTWYCHCKMKQVIIENGDCTLKGLSQLPKHVKEICLEFSRWNLDISELLLPTTRQVCQFYYGNTIEFIMEQVELYTRSLSNLAEILRKLSMIPEPKIVDKNIREFTSNKQAISLIKAILIKIQQNSTIVDNIIVRCIRNTFRPRLLMLLEEIKAIQ